MLSRRLPDRRAACLALRMAACALVLGGCSAEPKTPRRPHIIIYLVDTVRADHLGLYGYSRDTTPVLEEFAKQAVTFDWAYAQSSWTKASVGSLFTGLLPSRHGATRREHKLPSNVQTLAEIMQQLGYTTSAFIGNPIVMPMFGFGQGFDRVVKASIPAQAAFVHSKLFEYLDSKPEGPQLIYLHTMDPHAPYEPPPPFDDHFGQSKRSNVDKLIASYDSELAYMDSEFSKLRARLERDGLYDDALILFMSDHGEEFMDHKSLAHGHSLYQEQLHVPLLIRFPKGLHGGTRVERPVRLIDVMPTLLEYLAVDAPGDLDAHSFLPLAEGGEDETYQPLLYAELDLDQWDITSLIRDDYKLILRKKPKRGRFIKLFDIKRDPGEKQDLHAKHSEITGEMSQLMRLIEKSSRGGSYLDVTNASPAQAVHHVVGELIAVDGRFDEWEASGLEETDSAELSLDRKHVSFDFELTNLEMPFNLPPHVVVDIDTMKFTMEPEDTRLRLGLKLDGAPAPDFDLRLGKADQVTPTPLPFEVAGSESALLIQGQRPGASLPGERPHAWIYRIPALPKESAEISEELDARLRALGYVGDE